MNKQQNESHAEAKKETLSPGKTIDFIMEGGNEEAFTPAYLEIQKRPPAPLARIMVLVLMSVVLAVLLWSVFAEFDVVVTAPGKVVPAARVKVIQPLEPGIVKAIHVRDGQRVTFGQVLIELDPTTTYADRNRISRDVMEATLEVQRLQSQSNESGEMQNLPANADPALVRTKNLLLQNRLLENNQKVAALEQEIVRKKAEKAGVEATIKKLSSTLPHLEKRLKMKEELVKAGYYSDMSAIDNRIEVSNQKNDILVMKAKLNECDAAIAAATKNLAQVQAEFKSRTLAELSEAQKKFEPAKQDLIKAKQRMQQQLLTAPSDGIVQQLAVHTIGGVVTAAQPLLTVVPQGVSFEIEAQVLNKDIGFVRQGQDVIVKFDAFEYTKYGFLKGKLQWVGTDAIADQKLGLVYPIRIIISSYELPNKVDGRKPAIGAGMSVTADISVSKRKAYEYFLGPLLRYKNEALRER